ncbi:unnamed protein product [Brassicogethes aeneus]|uniref:RRM domain-containing protein n=1 Tax=Brassicogethes aeneus TaxID=1431903 RepID=A0A9P0B1U1_BRAAE|nr:unnamed protein product [Brassicogethes aeneus]
MAQATVLALNKKDQKKVVKKNEKLQKDLSTGKINVSEVKKQEKLTAELKRGLIYISHLPHGFYEDELKEYFKQFGNVTNVKVCRSCKTGRSKGFGYIEFANPEIAKIAAETMNNYLMFKKRIEATFVPYEKRPKSLFHGKSSNATTFSVKTRRTRQVQTKNKVLTMEEKARKTRTSLRNANNKLKKLAERGIKVNVKL